MKNWKARLAKEWLIFLSGELEIFLGKSESSSGGEAMAQAKRKTLIGEAMASADPNLPEVSADLPPDDPGLFQRFILALSVIGKKLRVILAYLLIASYLIVQVIPSIVWAVKTVRQPSE